MKMEMNELVERYKDNLFAAAFQICKNRADADDVVQDTFLQYYLADKQFETEEHIKAWLLRVAINRAKDLSRTFWKRNQMPLEDYMTGLSFEAEEEGELFETVMRLPEKYRIVIHLFYYEDYSVREISDVLKLSESNVKVRLSRGRKLLKKYLTGEGESKKKIHFV